MSDLSTQQQLKIQKAIRQSEDFLVTWIQDALDNRRSYGDLEESQFRNLVCFTTLVHQARFAL